MPCRSFEAIAIPEYEKLICDISGYESDVVEFQRLVKKGVRSSKAYHKVMDKRIQKGR